MNKTYFNIFLLNYWNLFTNFKRFFFAKLCRTTTT